MTLTPKPRSAPAHVLRPSRVKAVKAAPVPDKISFEYEGLRQERQRKYAGRASNTVEPLRITNAGVKKPYDGAELRPYMGRPDACAVLALPSRINNRLHYRDGRVTDLNGQPINPTEHSS